MIHGNGPHGFLLNANATTFVSRRPVSASDNQSYRAYQPYRSYQPSIPRATIPKLVTNSHLAGSSCDGTRSSDMEASKKRKKKKWDYNEGGGDMKSEQHMAMMSASDDSSSSSDSDDDSDSKAKKKKTKMLKEGPHNETHEYHKASKDGDKDGKKKNRCWEGYEPVEGKAPFSPNSCRKKKD